MSRPAVPAAEDLIEGGPGTPTGHGGVPGLGLTDPLATLGLHTDPPAESSRPRQGFDHIRYRNARPQAYGLVDVHVARMGPDGRVWIDGDPDVTAPLRQRCSVLSCLQVRTDYPGHLCVQADGTDEWRDWPCR